MCLPIGLFNLVRRGGFGDIENFIKVSAGRSCDHEQCQNQVEWEHNYAKSQTQHRLSPSMTSAKEEFNHNETALQHVESITNLKTTLRVGKNKRHFHSRNYHNDHERGKTLSITMGRERRETTTIYCNWDRQSYMSISQHSGIRGSACHIAAWAETSMCGSFLDKLDINHTLARDKHGRIFSGQLSHIMISN